MIRTERTTDRKLAHLRIKNAYIGALQDQKIVIFPHLADHLEEIKALLPRGYDRFEMVVGVPATWHLPFELTPAPAKKAAKKKTTRTRQNDAT